MILEKFSQSAVIQSPFRPSSAVCDHLLELAMLRQALLIGGETIYPAASGISNSRKSFCTCFRSVAHRCWAR